MLEEDYQDTKRKRVPMINYLSAIGLLMLVSLFGLMVFYDDPMWDEQVWIEPEVKLTPENVTIVFSTSDTDRTTVTVPDEPVPAPAPALPDEPSPEETEFSRRRESIDHSASFLINQVTLDTPTTPSPREILVSHTGAMYALGMYHDFQANDETRSALLQAGDFLQSYCIASLPDDDRLLEAWARHELTAGAGPVQAKLSGGGLGLVALLSMEKAAPGSTSRKQLRALASFILAMQNDNGSFPIHSNPSRGYRWGNWNPHEYPGQISLGLLQLYEHDSDPRWVEGATRALTHLARIREDLSEVPADHWSLLATAQLFSLPPDLVSEADRKMLLMHSIQVVRSIMYDQIIISDSPHLIGAFSEDGRITSTATRLEALLASLEIIPERETRLRERISMCIERGVQFLVKAQRQDGEMPIDHAQHNLSVLIRYVEAFDPGQNRTALVEN